MLEIKDKKKLCSLLVDRLITASMKYNESLSSEYSLLEFDVRAKDLCLIRKKVISALRRAL